jgi:DNA-binding CsgD family transcriptional regulator
MATDDLSPRELDIAQLIADDVAPRQIAEELGISPETVRTHVQNALRRIGVSHRSALVAYCFREGLIE